MKPQYNHIFWRGKGLNWSSLIVSNKLGQHLSDRLGGQLKRKLSDQLREASGDIE